jgi:hypothetical protein
LSTEKKEEYLKKQRIARQQKKAADKLNEPAHLQVHGKKYNNPVELAFIYKSAHNFAIQTCSADKNQARRETAQARRDVLTPDDREVINAQRRIARQHKPEIVIQQENAHRRASRQNLTIDDRNSARRAHRQSLTPGEMHTMLTKRNANDKARRNTPCAQSIAMMCPHAISDEHIVYPPTVTNGSSIVDPFDSPHASPSACTPNYTININGNFLALLCFLYPVSFYYQLMA